MHKAARTFIQLTYTPTHENLRKTINAQKNIKHQRHSKLEKHSESGIKLRCILNA